MVQYKCDRCLKEFGDKTKLAKHNERKFKCMDKNPEHILKTDIDDETCVKAYLSKLGKVAHSAPPVTNEICQSKNGENRDILPTCDNLKMPQTTRPPENINICKLCKNSYQDKYIDHLVKEHDIFKEERVFTFYMKDSGLKIYENEEECGDIVIYGFENNRCLLFMSKNLHNLQRHKREKYKNVRFITFFPCKNVKDFKTIWKEYCDEVLKKDDKDFFDYQTLYNFIKESIHLVNNEDRLIKNIASFKSNMYFQCPFCDATTTEKDQMDLHLTESHRFQLKVAHTLVFNEEEKNKIYNIFENNSSIRNDISLFNNTTTNNTTTNNTTTNNIVSNTTTNESFQKREFRCDYCNCVFAKNFNLKRHQQNNCKKYHQYITHELRNDAIKHYLKNDNDDVDKLIEYNENLKRENKKLREALTNNHEVLKDNNEILKNSVNCINKTTNIIQNNNILFNINDFGKEDISHIDSQFIEDIINQMSTNSLIKFIEEVHYGNPSNWNVLIPTDIPAVQDNNLLLLKKGDRWVLEKRSNVIDDMLTVNIDRIADVYGDISDNLSKNVKDGFETYVQHLENEPNGHVRTDAIYRTEELIRGKQPNSMLLENIKIQQNNFIDGNWRATHDLTIPQKKISLGNISGQDLQDIIDKPIIVSIDDELKNLKSI